MKSSAIERWTYIRCVEMQLWPAWEKPATRIFVAAVLQSPSGSITTGALFPSSSPTRLRGARARIAHPTGGDPVKVMSAMSGWSTMALPTVPPPPVTTWSCSAGRPHSSMRSSASAMDENGVWLAGFSTTGQPAAMAGATLCTTRLSGKLNGAMAPTTPMGTRSVKPSFPSPAAPASSGTISPASLRASAAANENVPDARSASTRAVLMGLAASRGDDPGEVLPAFGQQARRGVQYLGPLPQREGAGGERGLGRGDGAVDVLPGAGRHLPQHGSVVGRLDGDGLRWRCAAPRPAAAHGRQPWPDDTAGMPYAFLDHPGPIPFAHRGGALEGLENTMPAFEAAMALGYRYLETDARVTADGVLVAFHDDDLSRTCDRAGSITKLPWSEVQAARVGGKEPIPLLEDVLGAFPQARINLDAKSDGAVAPLIDAIRRTASVERVCVGCLQREADQADPICPRPDVVHVDGTRWRWRGGRPASWLLGGRGTPSVPVAQVPVKQYGIPIVTGRSVRAADRHGVQVHVWTIDEPAEIERLLDLGVHGIMTDRPLVLKEVLQRRGQWFE